MPHILIINPWIYDFAAYDLWAKPMGLLYLSAMLKEAGFYVSFIDCLSPYSLTRTLASQVIMPPRKSFGTGKYFATEIDKPSQLAKIKRRYRRYGIPVEVFNRALNNLHRPDVILVGSMMTYWYPGVKEVVSLVRKKWPDIPVGLGGIYATLCSKHAQRFIKPDRLFIGRGLVQLWEWLSEMGFNPAKPPPLHFSDWPIPSWDHYHRLDYGCIMTSKGCPFRCPYCASKILSPSFEERPVEKVLDELEYLHSLSIKDIAFYDDALLVNADKRFLPMMEAICKKGWHIRFHTPNALHVSLMTKEVCEMLKKGGFQTIRMGVETLDRNRQKIYGEKSKPEDLEWAINNLKQAGFPMENVGAYILYGLPDQPIEEVENSLLYLKKVGVKAYLAEYSPISETLLWEKAIYSSPFSISDEPLYQNNSLLPCWYERYSEETVLALKNMARQRDY